MGLLIYIVALISLCVMGFLFLDPPVSMILPMVAVLMVVITEFLLPRWLRG